MTDLRILVKDCGFTNEDRMIRDAIVLRARHDQVKEKCLDEGNALTLEKLVSIGQNYETSHDSLKVIGGNDDGSKRDVKESECRQMP